MGGASATTQFRLLVAQRILLPLVFVSIIRLQVFCFCFFYFIIQLIVLPARLLSLAHNLEENKSSVQLSRFSIGWKSPSSKFNFCQTYCYIRVMDFCTTHMNAYGRFYLKFCQEKGVNIFSLILTKQIQLVGNILYIGKMEAAGSYNFLS